MGGFTTKQEAGRKQPDNAQKMEAGWDKKGPEFPSGETVCSSPKTRRVGGMGRADEWTDSIDVQLVKWILRTTPLPSVPFPDMCLSSIHRAVGAVNV